MSGNLDSVRGCQAHHNASSALHIGCASPLAEPLEARAHGFARLNDASQAQVAGMLAPLSGEEQARLLGTMRDIQRLLGTPPTASVVRRGLKSGDIGWSTRRQGQF